MSYESTLQGRIHSSSRSHQSLLVINIPLDHVINQTSDFKGVKLIWEVNYWIERIQPMTQSQVPTVKVSKAHEA